MWRYVEGFGHGKSCAGIDSILSAGWLLANGKIEGLICRDAERGPAVQDEPDQTEKKAFMRHLLSDMEALDRMLESGAFEADRRIGAELEMFLVDEAMRPASIGPDLLVRANDERLTTELARFNLEANASPRHFRGNCLRELEKELIELVGLVGDVADERGAKVLLAGILPTLRQSDLGLDNMTPVPRYRRLNDTITGMRHGEIRFTIEGQDELEVKHGNVMLESANTSFQIHFQVAPDEFARLYNLAQVITGPVLASAVNSPLFLGRNLWSETRIAVFQRAVDERRQTDRERSAPGRVSFGDDWVKDSVLEVFRDQIARHRMLLHEPVDEDALAILEAGGIPKLKALRIHNGTVYRWNRACYGITDGQPHLRIENRALPAGPTIQDQMANAAFFYGLLAGFLQDGTDVTTRMSFNDARKNFFAAARYGLGARMKWMDGKVITAPPLILDELLPLARRGLTNSQINEDDVDHYLGIIEERVRSGRTGATWMTDSLASMDPKCTKDRKERALTAALIEHQQSPTPAHKWPLASCEQQVSRRESYRRVDQFMTRKLFTVRADDLVNLAACLMDWEHIKYVPVEDESGQLVGLLTYRSLLRLLTQAKQTLEKDIYVSELMQKDPVIVAPETKTLDAMRLMRAEQVSALPVVDKGELVGIITERDLIEVSVDLLEKFLEE
jgi:CBS domain-containing protein/gamma-glutamyl:cysteine ligase YbdK (ATP-grasp superfamily)